MHQVIRVLSNSAPAKLQCVSGFSRVAIAAAISALMSLSFCNAAIAGDSVELRPAPVEAVPLSGPVAAPAPVQKKITGTELLLYPINHPIATTEKLVFPVVHPIKTVQNAFNGFCRIGKWSEQKGLTAGLSLVGALGNVATPFAVGAFK